jgi:hypothetical protein
MVQAKGVKRTAAKPAKAANKAATKSRTEAATAAPTKQRSKQSSKQPIKPGSKPTTRPSSRPTASAPSKAKTKPAQPTANDSVKATGPKPQVKKKAGPSPKPAASDALGNGALKTADTTKGGAARQARLTWEADGGFDTRIDSETGTGGNGASLLDQENKGRPRKPKLVRDSFTMPEDEYRLLGEIKKNCMREGFSAKRSELLRIGLAMIWEVSTAELKRKLAELDPLKTARPKKEK